MQDFVDGELAENQSQEIIEHIHSCKACQIDLRDILTLCDALHRVVDADQCPSVGALKDYANEACSDEQADKIRKHVEFCGRCSLYVWSFRASEKELAEWQAQEDQAYLEYEAQELGRDRADKVLSRLLPSETERFDRIWQAALTFVSDWKGRAIENWPDFGIGMPLAGGLGFSEPCDLETEAACILLITTLYVSSAISGGQIDASQEALETTTKRVATKLGAGKELQGRLVETLSPLILTSG